MQVWSVYNLACSTATSKYYYYFENWYRLSLKNHIFFDNYFEFWVMVTSSNSVYFDNYLESYLPQSQAKVAVLLRPCIVSWNKLLTHFSLT